MRFTFLYQMKAGFTCISILLWIFTHAQQQQLRDTIFFKDGSVVVGKIKKIKLGVVTFDPANTNDITVQLRLLRTMAAIRTVFRIETVSGKVYYGHLFPQADTSFVQ